MKKFFNFGASLLLALTMSGCVEINEDYDFSKLNTEEITIGDEFVAPIAKITTSIADMELGDWADILPDGDVQKAAPLTEITFEQNYPISGGIDQSIIDMLTAQGQLYLLVDIENYTPVFFECYAHFLDAEGNVVAQTTTAETTSATHASMAELVITCTLVGVAKYVVSLGSLLELFFGFLVIGIAVGVIFDGHLFIGLLYLVV